MVCVYRRVSTRMEPLRELLERHDFHAVSPPDALGEWEYHHDDGVRVRGAAGLVLVEADDERFSVALIPHTLALTTLGELGTGDSVHLETDILAKYIARQLEGIPR